MESPFSREAGCSPVAVLRNLLLSQLGVLRAALKCLTALSLCPAPCHRCPCPLPHATRSAPAHVSHARVRGCAASPILSLFSPCACPGLAPRHLFHSESKLCHTMLLTFALEGTPLGWRENSLFIPF